MRRILWHTKEMNKEVSAEEVGGVIDHTFLKTEREGVSPADQKKEVHKLVAEAHRWGAFSVCVREKQVAYAKDLLSALGSTVKIVSVIGFPIGDEYSTTRKVSLLEQAREDGADEFDMVFNVQAFHRGEVEVARQDLIAVSRAAGSQVLKVIFENAYLAENEKKPVYEMARRAFLESFDGDASRLASRFFKTSTGFAKPPEGIPVGATLHDVSLMHAVGEGAVGIKPAGGVNSLDDAKAYFTAVGSPRHEGKMDPAKFRIGTSSLLSKLFGEAGQGGY